MFFSRFCRVLPPTLLVLLIGFPAAAQEPDSAVDPKIVLAEKTVDAFFADLQTSETETENAFKEVLLKGSTQLLSEAKRPALNSLIQKTDALLKEKYGKYRGHERISAKSIGKDLLLLKYLYKCEHYPIVWHFTFYRKGKTSEPAASPWNVIAVRFDTDLELLALGK